MKIYIARNMDGVNQAAVMASNLKEAAERLRVSVYQLRQFGWSNSESDALRAILNDNDIVWRPINDYQNRHGWRSKRWTRHEMKIR